MPTGIYGNNMSLENATQWLKMNPAAAKNAELLKVADYNDNKTLEPAELAQAYNNDVVKIDGIRSFKVNPNLTNVDLSKPSAQEQYYQNRVQEDKTKAQAAKVGAGVAVGVGAAVGIGWLLKTAVLDNLR